jgi:hypothetical protein
MPSTEKATEVAKIIKRLELIKNLIALEEEKEISIHLLKLKEYSLNGELGGIIILLEEKSYSKAMAAIEAFINKHHQLIVYSDSELEGLKLEAKTLEAELNLLSNEKADLEKLIHEFAVRHNQELGELIIKLLRLRKEQSKGTPQQAEAEKDYEDYHKEYEITKEEKIIELTDEELKELKQKYRQASKLCHPDVVSEEQKELANKIFSELNEAYERNDLQRVREILDNLEKGDFFINKSDAVNEKQLMKVEIEKLRLRIKELKEQLQVIKESETYTTITTIGDWDNYFKETKQKLSKELTILENEH